METIMLSDLLNEEESYTLLDEGRRIFGSRKKGSRI